MDFVMVLASEESFGHVTLGEWLVSLTAVVLAVGTGALFWATEKLWKATSTLAVAEMRKVATNANDDMAKVAVAAIDSQEENHDHRPAVKRPVRRQPSHWVAVPHKTEGVAK